MAARERTERRRRRARTRRSWPRRVVHLGLAMISVASLLVFAGVMYGNATQRFRLAPVLSGSMSPEIPMGSLAIAAPIPRDDVRVGDVILFNAPSDGNPLTMHRIHEIERRKDGTAVYTTKGDANDVPDAWEIVIRGDSAWRVVHHVPEVGAIMGVLTGVSVRMIVLVGGGVSFLFTALSVVWGGRPIAWRAHDPHGVMRRRERRQTTRRILAVTTVGSVTVGALTLAGFVGARFTGAPEPAPEPTTSTTVMECSTPMSDPTRPCP